MASALAFLLLWAMLPAGEAMAQGVRVTADRLNMRAEANTSSKAIAVVKEGSLLEFVSECGEWYQVRYQGKTGYVMGDYVSLDMEGVRDDIENTAEAFSSVGRTTARVNLRALPMTGSDVVKVLPVNEQVQVTGRHGAWYAVTCGSKKGYLMAQYVKPEEASAPEKEPEKEQETLQPEENAGGAVMPCTGAALVRVNMRKEPSTGSSIVNVIAENGRVTVVGQTGDWYQTEADGKTGYIRSEYLRLEENKPAGDESQEDAEDAQQPEESIQPDAVIMGSATGDLNLRSGAGTDSSVIRVLKKGTQAEVLGISGDFYLVMHEGTLGYVSKKYMKIGSASGSAESLYPEMKTGETTATVNMRREPEGKILHTLQAGKQVTMLGESGGWVKVLYRGEAGYISAQYLTEAPETEEDAGETEAPAGKDEPKEEFRKAYVTAKSLNLRKGPGTGYGIVRVLSYGAEVEFDSLENGWYHVRIGGDEGYLSAEYVSTDRPAGAEGGSAVGRVILSDWYTGEVASVFDRGDKAVLTDVKTGLSFEIQRTGGYNHADAQPLTAQDTKIMYRIYGYSWQWTRRPVWITVDGRTYAASMNGMPHGETDVITGNDFEGCFCIHFLNSRTHGTDRVDSAHQNCVQEAYKAG